MTNHIELFVRAFARANIILDVFRDYVTFRKELLLILHLLYLSRLNVHVVL